MDLTKEENHRPESRKRGKPGARGLQCRIKD